MSYFMDGDMDDNNENQKKSLIDKGIQLYDTKLTELCVSNIKSDIDRLDISIINNLENAKKLLEDIINLKVRLNYEIKKYGKTTSYPGSLDNYERQGEFNLFITMLGFIDSKISKCNREISFNAAFFEYDEFAAKRYTEYKAFREHLLIEREKVISAYKNYITTNNNHEEDFSECLDTIPCSTSFSKLSTDEFNSKAYSNLLPKFIIAYNIGYSATTNDYRKVLRKYNELYTELDNYSKSKKTNSSIQKKKVNLDK